MNHGRTTIAITLLLLGGCAEQGAPIHARGEVVSSEHGLSPGTECEVRIDNETKAGLPCRVSVECGGRALFGSTMPGGYAWGEVREERWRHVYDHHLETEDGDPYMDYDVDARTVIVRTVAGETVVTVNDQDLRA